MKTLLKIFCFIVILQSYSQTKLSVSDWQSDLRFLQNTVHENFSFLFKKFVYP